MSQKPGITERMRLALRVYRDGMPTRYNKASPIRFAEWRVNQPLWQITDLDTYIAEGFNSNALIYSAIMYKAKALSSVPLRAYTGERDAPEIVADNHPLAQLLTRPNTSQSWREFQMLQTVYLNLSGNAFTFFDRQGDQITQMVPLNPLRTYIIPGTRGSVKGFLYVPEGMSITDGVPMLPEDVSHVKFPNPGDDLDGQGYGLSPLSAAARSADVDNRITEFLNVFFKRGTAVNTVLQFDAILDDSDVARIRTRWEETYGGVTNWGKVGIIDQQGKAENLGYSFDEMGFEVLDERNEARILGVFGVPPILVGSRLGLLRSTYANYKEAYNSFWSDTMLHEAMLFEDDYAYYLQDGDAWVAFDFSDVPAFQDDVASQVAAWKELVMLGVPKTQAAAVVGLDLGDLEDGDVAYMPTTLVPIAEAAENRAAALAMLNKPPAEETPEEETPTEAGQGDGTPAEAVEDERDEAKALTMLVKKNGHRPSASGTTANGTQLIGVTKARSKMAQKARSNTTGEKS
jgi:HK97 family phage portal protein